VGATATAVAASRALASQNPNALLDDPWADPLVRAVGIDTFVKLIDGETGQTDDPLLNRQLLRAGDRFRHPAGRDLGVGLGHQGLPTAVADRNGGL
jgi:O-methyltransferase involved in polyketide biosynthesis